MDPSDDDYECQQIFQIMSWRFKREKYDKDDVFSENVPIIPQMQ